MSEIKFALNNVQAGSFIKSEILEKVKKNLPAHIKTLGSQVAGHDYAIFQDTKTGYILKPIFDGRGIREEVFYKQLFNSKYDQNTSLTKLRIFLPKYIETQVINDVKFVTLTDLTLNAVTASLMDVKIGVIVYDRHATGEKIKRESIKDHLSKKLGFRVLAIKKWIKEKNDYENVDRDFCRTCTSEQEEKIIECFIKQSDEIKTRDLVSSIVDQLKVIKDWFDNENIDLFEFIGSSILFIYSYHNDQLDCRVKLIDFAHIYPLEGSKINLNDQKKDENYLFGLNALIKLIEKTFVGIES